MIQTARQLEISSIIHFDGLAYGAYTKDDIGFSQFFYDATSASLRYVPAYKRFIFYNGKYWEKDDQDNTRVNEAIKIFVAEIIKQVPYSEDKDSYYKHFAKYKRQGKRASVVTDIKSINPIVPDYDGVLPFDKDGYLLNLENGTLNLRTGKLLPHDPEDLITHISAVEWNPEADATVWNKFISDIMCENENYIHLLQQACGYSLSTDTFRECFFICDGPTARNGKGTLELVMSTLLGSYAQAANPYVFASRKYGGQEKLGDDVAMLAGSRYVAVNEPEEGMVLNASLIKMMSGFDKIQACFKFENTFSFRSTFKVWFQANHRPQISDQSVFDSNRVILIPFEKHFEGETLDPGMKARLQEPENLSAALAWMLKGYQEVYKRQDIEVPEEVKARVDEYRRDNDKIADFTENCIITCPGEKIKFTELYKVFSLFCRDANMAPLSKKRFERLLSGDYLVKDFHHQKTVFDVKFLPEADEYLRKL